MVTGDDIVLVISNSGHTSEIIRIIPIVKNMGAKVVALTGGLSSPIAQQSDAVIDVGVEREACPMGLAPTASTTAALAMGDALAVVLINSRRFDQKDFKRFHPGGSLGERLSIRVKEVMHTGDHIPLVVRGTGAGHAIREMDAKGIGATLVLDENGGLEGIITDGDLRRALITKEDISELNVEEIMSPHPKTVEADQTAAEALGLMELYGITHLVILDRQRKVQGVVHLHDLLGREDFRLNGPTKLTTGPNRRPDHSP
jgi:arabinose-5-phosphate isomerase